MDNPVSLSVMFNSLAQTYQGDVRKQMNRMSVRLALMSVIVATVGAKNVAFDVDAPNITPEEFAEGAAVTNFTKDDTYPVLLGWGKRRSNFRVTNTAAAAAAANAGNPAILKDLLGKNLLDHSEALASDINGQCFTGAGTTDAIAGTQSVAIRDDNTYGGIDRTAGAGVTNAWWKATVIDPGVTTPVSFALIRSDLATIKKKSGRRPDVAYVEPGVHNAVKALFDGNREWKQDVSTAGRGLVTLDNSPGVVIIDGCQFIEDKDAPAGEISYENSSKSYIEVLPQVVSFASPIGAASDGFNKLMLGFSAYELGRVGSDRRMSIEAHLQLVIEQPNAFGRRLRVAT